MAKIRIILSLFFRANGICEVESTEPISFGDLTSVGDCHDECKGGCTEPHSATACFSCKSLTQTLRNKAGNGFKCVTKCEDTYYLDGDKCKMCSPHCHTCTEAEVCETCPGSLLLIDVKSTGQIFHGQCVDRCPDELVPDYETNLIQARCILKTDKCGPGYFIDAVGKCGQCDEACELCHGPGALSCDSCSKDYGNRSTGYCRPCCKGGENPDISRCEDCSPNAKYPVRHPTSSGSFFSFIWILIIIIIVVVMVALCVCLREDKKQFEYTPLYNGETDKVKLMAGDEELSSSSSDDEEVLPIIRNPEI